MSLFRSPQFRFGCLLALVTSAAAPLPAQSTGEAPAAHSAVSTPGSATSAAASTSPASGAAATATPPPSSAALAGQVRALRASTHNDSTSHVPSDAVLKQFLNGPHTTEAAQAVVGVEVTNHSASGAEETRRCSGLLLRCDGFFLLPPAFTALKLSSGEEAIKQTVRVTLEPGTPQEHRAFAYVRHYTVEGIDLTVMKLQEVHAPAARPLLSEGLKVGDEVEIAWTEWDAGAGHFTVVKRKSARIGEQPKEASELKTREWKPGEIGFAQMQEGVAAGAVVIGPDGMALGVMPGAAKRHDRFVSFSLLERVTNCVIPAPTTDAEFERLQKKAEDDSKDPTGEEKAEAKLDGSADATASAKTESSAVEGGAKTAHPINDMVEIPGGPVRLPAVFQKDQRDMCGEVIACVPTFKIDRYKVSNKEYYAFWKSVPEKERAKKEVRAALYPLSWAETDPPFPGELDDVPVLGVPLTGAQAYAHSQGKRLPTTHEWSRAALGPLGDAVLPAWVHAYILDRQATWARLVNAHLDYEDSLLQAFGAGSDFPPRTIPFFSPYERYTSALAWSQASIAAEMKRLCEKWRDPLYVLPAGSRPFDESPFGVRDVLLNGNERVLYSPEPNPLSEGEHGKPQAVQMLWNGFPYEQLRVPRTNTPLLAIVEPIVEPVPVIDPAFSIPETTTLLLSRRLTAPSALVRPERGEFSPSDSEAYAEFKARIYEAMMMILPISQLQLAPVWYDKIVDDHWGEGTVSVRNAPPPDKGTTPTGLVSAGHTWSVSQVYEGRWNGTFDYGFVQKRISTLVEIQNQPIGYDPPRLDRILSKRGRLTGAYLPRPGNYLYNQPPAGFQELLSKQEATGTRLDEAELLFRGMYFDETPSYSAWAGPSPFMRREMGRDWAKDPPEHVGPWPRIGWDLTQPPSVFLVANGFRCAR